MNPDSPSQRRWREVADIWVLPLVPALLAGAEVSGILFFLNPELPVAFLPFARASFYFALLAAPVSIVAHRFVARSRGVELARLVPWSLTLIATLGAIGDGVHASRFAFLLPEAMNRQLIKAALWIGFAAVLMFYTALLHTFQHRRYGWKSRLLFAVAVIGGTFAMVDRRASFRPIVLPPPALAADAGVDAPRVVLVELPTATLDAVLPLARQGRLPFLARMVEGGSAARLSSWPPSRREPQRASWATGKMPARHLIVGERRYPAPVFGSGLELSLLPFAPGFELWGLLGIDGRPLEARDRGALAVWEILDRLSRDSSAIGFPDWLGGSPFAATEEGTVFGAGERELAARGRSDLAELLARERRRFASVRVALGSSPRASFTALSFDGLEEASLSSYGGFAAARFGGSRAGAASRAADAYEIFLGGLDAELARLWEELPPPRLLAVSSAYGIAAPEGLARFARAFTSGPREYGGTLEGPPPGMLLVLGDDLQSTGQVAEAHAVDLVPTLLYAADAPIARDFDGRVLTELFTPALLQRRALTFVPSFEGLPQR